MCHTILIGALVGIWLQRPVGPRVRNLSSATHGNHTGVQQPTIGPQLRVDIAVVSLAGPVNVVPLMLTNWMNHHPILPAPSRWSQERASQPRKFEFDTSYKNEYK
jgi:hypothetical protein